jgi:hypothetical protein
LKRSLRQIPIAIHQAMVCFVMKRLMNFNVSGDSGLDSGLQHLTDYFLNQFIE